MLDHACGNFRRPLVERGNDLYETPEVAPQSLLRYERLPPVLWECACGPGKIVTVLRQAGHKVYATDLVDYGCPDSVGGVDFLMENSLPHPDIGAIITNPPFKLDAQFVEKALELCPKVIMLLRLAFLEGGNRETEASRARRLVLDGGHLARVYVYRKRLPMMHRVGWEGRKANSGMAFAWYVWDREYSSPWYQVRRISWERQEVPQ